MLQAQERPFRLGVRFDEVERAAIDRAVEVSVTATRRRDVPYRRHRQSVDVPDRPRLPAMLFG